MAASVLVILPVLFVFILTQRWIVKGITLTGMK
jgi:ABC-type glycerol-3-phosphate transport system permease component